MRELAKEPPSFLRTCTATRLTFTMMTGNLACLFVAQMFIFDVEDEDFVGFVD